MKTGILAFQGCIEPHAVMLRQLGSEVIYVRSPEELWSTDRLILPGGESTTMLKFLDRQGMFQEIQKYAEKHPVWGVCAGSILMAKEVTNPEQRSLGLLPIRAVRNFYGSQRESFEGELQLTGIETPLQVQFIRAPAIEVLDPKVEITASHNGHPVAVRYGHLMATTFHTELGNDGSLHKLFLDS